MREPVLVLYRGDEVVGVGTKEELAEMLDIQPKSVNFYASPANVRRASGRDDKLVAVRVYEESIDD